MAKPYQGWAPRPSSQAGQIRVTPLGQKGSPAKGGVRRAAQRNFRATWQLFCSAGRDMEGPDHSAV